MLRVEVGFSEKFPILSEFQGGCEMANELFVYSLIAEISPRADKMKKNRERGLKRFQESR